MTRSRTTRLAVVALWMGIGAACGDAGAAVKLPSLDQVPAPQFSSRPEDLADSAQLDALVARDTAGLGSTSESANGVLLPLALAALAEIENPPSQLTGVWINADSVYFSYYQDGVAGRSVTAVYRQPGESDPDQTPDFSISEPTFDDSEEFALSVVVPSVPAELAAALTNRFPLASFRSMDLGVSRSYGFGLAWNISLDDARGSFATIFADPDGSIIAVDDGQ